MIIFCLSARLLKKRQNNVSSNLFKVVFRNIPKIESVWVFGIYLSLTGKYDFYGPLFFKTELYYLFKRLQSASNSPKV